MFVFVVLSVLLEECTAQGGGWRDIISSLIYQDGDEAVMEEEGSGRLGFVQLNSGSTSFNTTLNLTGPILLGLGIAAATLFYAYFHAFQGSGGYSRYKRFVSEPGFLDIEAAVLALGSLDQNDDDIYNVHPVLARTEEKAPKGGKMAGNLNSGAWAEDDCRQLWSCMSGQYPGAARMESTQFYLAASKSKQCGYYFLSCSEIGGFSNILLN